MNKPLDNDIIDLIREDPSREKGFRLLVERYQKKIYWHARRLVLNHDDADDVVQETFLKVWRNLDSFRGESEIYTWVYRIATNESFAFLKKKKKRFTLPLFSNDNHSSNSSYNEAFHGDGSIMDKFKSALESLPEKQRLVFNLKYFDEMKYEEISKITGVSVGALKASYHHATKKIEKSVTDF